MVVDFALPLLILLLIGGLLAFLGVLPSSRRQNDATAIELPESIAERRRLMALEGEDGPTTRLIKEAARQRVAPERSSWAVTALRRVNRGDEQALAELRRSVLLGVLCGGAVGAVVGYQFGVAPLFAAVAMGLGAGSPLSQLKKQGELIELTRVAAMIELVRPLTIILERAFDLTTTVRELLAGAGPAAVDDPILQLLERGVVLAREEQLSLSLALRKVSREVESPTFSRLCGILQLVEGVGGGWRTPLVEFAADLEGRLRLGAKTGAVPRKQHDHERFYPQKGNWNR